MPILASWPHSELLSSRRHIFVKLKSSSMESSREYASREKSEPPNGTLQQGVRARFLRNAVLCNRETTQTPRDVPP
jgi:hypothetical protein